MLSYGRGHGSVRVSEGSSLAVGAGDTVALRVGGLDDEFQVGHIAGDGGFGVCFFCADAYAFSSGGIVFYVLPFEQEDVAQAKSGEAGESDAFLSTG